MALPVLPILPILQFFTETGDGLGNVEFNGNYSVTPKSIFLNAVSGKQTFITHLQVSVVSNNSFYSGKYGDQPALTNGIQLLVNSQGITLDVLKGHPIKSNREWMSISNDVGIVDYLSSNEQGVFHLDILEFPTPIGFQLVAGDYIKFVLNDDFSGLASHRFLAKGYLL